MKPYFLLLIGVFILGGCSRDEIKTGVDQKVELKRSFLSNDQTYYLYTYAYYKNTIIGTWEDPASPSNLISDSLLSNRRKEANNLIEIFKRLDK